MKMLSAVWALMLLGLGFAFFSPVIVSAHTLKVDGNIGVILHINPDDDPIAQQESVFFPDITDKSSKFQLSDCDCKVKITQGSDILYQTVLIPAQTSSKPNNTSFSYTFPAKGVYNLDIQGHSYTSSFSDFKVDYDIRVAREANLSETPSHTGFVEYLIFGSGLLVILVIIFADFRLRANQKTKQKKNTSGKILLIIALIAGLGFSPHLFVHSHSHSDLHSKMGLDCTQCVYSSQVLDSFDINSLAITPSSGQILKLASQKYIFFSSFLSKIVPKLIFTGVSRAPPV